MNQHFRFEVTLPIRRVRYAVELLMLRVDNLNDGLDRSADRSIEAFEKVPRQFFNRFDT